MPEPHDALQKRAIAVIKILRTATKDMVPPAGEAIVKKFGQDPFVVLASCILSLRTKDTVSLPASIRLLEAAKTPARMLKLSLAHIQKLIYPVGFYRRKAGQLHAICKKLLDEYDGKVPSSMNQLLALPGVGRKTANLVLADGFGKPGLCVDTHVHRICNRLGLVKTKTPEETEMALRALLPQKYWSEFNKLLVMWGQNICMPISPFCSRCTIADLCPRRGVTKHR